MSCHVMSPSMHYIYIRNHCGFLSTSDNVAACWCVVCMYVQLVYDKDTFSTDDFMGEAEIDIQPLVIAAKAYEKSNINESMQLGKFVASKDNTLVRDGIISLDEGKIKQEISVRLQNIERGELELELECVPLTQ